MGKKYFTVWKMILLVSFLLLIPISGETVDAVDKDAPAFVMIDGRELFQIKVPTGFLSPEERAKIIEERILNIAKNRRIEIEQIQIDQVDETVEISADHQIIMTITKTDLKGEREPIMGVAQEKTGIIKSAIEEYRRERIPRNMLIMGLYGILLTVVLWCASWLGNFVLNRGRRRLLGYKDKMEQYSVKIQNFEVVSANHIHAVVSKSFDMMGWIFKGTGLYFYLFLLLGLFPGTRKYANELLYYIVTALSMVIEKILDYLPNVVIILIIVVISRYFLKLIYIFFQQVKNGTIQISGFYIEWVEPTYKIVRFLVLALALISIFPYIPGSQSSAFQGISVFLGVLFSLGSTSAVSNVIAGIALTYTRAFVIGDRVRIGDNVGDVIEKTLLATRIRTIKNVEITIPNSIILGGSIINYNTSAKEVGLILNAKVTIGYDVPWRTVHQLLITAALRTPDVLETPIPFVLQTSLEDFSVAYEINAYTQKANSMAQIYSDLYRNIQDTFNEGNVEIMSPQYHALRDGNQRAIPNEQLSK